jgi:hypothetical protein
MSVTDSCASPILGKTINVPTSKLADITHALSLDKFIKPTSLKDKHLPLPPKPGGKKKIN